MTGLCIALSLAMTLAEVRYVQRHQFARACVPGLVGLIAVIGGVQGPGWLQGSLGVSHAMALGPVLTVACLRGTRFAQWATAVVRRKARDDDPAVSY